MYCYCLQFQVVELSNLAFIESIILDSRNDNTMVAPLHNVVSSNVFLRAYVCDNSESIGVVTTTSNSHYWG